MSEETGGHPMFLKALEVMRATHIRKAAEYGTGEDPFRNIHEAEDFGVSPWKGALIRLNDKTRSIGSYARTGKVPDEGVEDTLVDIAAFAIIALVAWQEEQGG